MKENSKNAKLFIRSQDANFVSHKQIIIENLNLQKELYDFFNK